MLSHPCQITVRRPIHPLAHPLHVSATLRGPIFPHPSIPPWGLGSKPIRPRALRTKGVGDRTVPIRDEKGIRAPGSNRRDSSRNRPGRVGAQGGVRLFQGKGREKKGDGGIPSILGISEKIERIRRPELQVNGMLGLPPSPVQPAFLGIAIQMAMLVFPSAPAPAEIIASGWGLFLLWFLCAE
jgi:hypothetical protein